MGISKKVKRGELDTSACSLSEKFNSVAPVLVSHRPHTHHHHQQLQQHTSHASNDPRAPVFSLNIELFISFLPVKRELQLTHTLERNSWKVAVVVCAAVLKARLRLVGRRWRRRRRDARSWLGDAPGNTLNSTRTLYYCVHWHGHTDHQSRKSTLLCFCFFFCLPFVRDRDQFLRTPLMNVSRV